jgi:hypothetical protein
MNHNSLIHPSLHPGIGVPEPGRRAHELLWHAHEARLARRHRRRLIRRALKRPQ